MNEASAPVNAAMVTSNSAVTNPAPVQNLFSLFVMQQYMQMVCERTAGQYFTVLPVDTKWYNRFLHVDGLS